MKLPAYPRTKPSGVEWLGDVPEHWEVKRLRRVLAESLQYGANESAELDDPDLPRYVRITDVHENGTLRPDTFRSLPKDVAAPYLLKDGDLLFARSGATSGKTFLYQNSWGICAYAGYLIRARMNQQKAVPAFVKYFTTSTNYWQWLSSVFIQSTIQNVSAEKYADLHLSLPPVPEQRAIAAFLGRETGRVDRLVAKKAAQDHAGMQLHLQPAVDRFKAMVDDAKRSEFREKLNGYVNIYSFMSQIMPYGDPALEMLFSYGRFLLPHLPLDRDTERVKLGDEVSLQYYRLARIYSGEIMLNEGEPEGVKSPTDVGSGKAKEEKAPLSEIIKVLNERFGTNFTDEDRFFFEQIREKATANDQVVKLRRANPFDKFQLGLRQLIENLMVQRMTDNDKIVTRYMDDKEFGDAAFNVLSKAIYESIPKEEI